MAADVSTVLPAELEIEPFVIDGAGAALDRCDDDTVALFAPRVWASLEARERRDPRAFQARYLMDGGELDELARSLGWAAAAAA